MVVLPLRLPTACAPIPMTRERHWSCLRPHALCVPGYQGKQARLPQKGAQRDSGGPRAPDDVLGELLQSARQLQSIPSVLSLRFIFFRKMNNRIIFYKVELAVSTPTPHPVARLPLRAASPWHPQLPLWATVTGPKVPRCWRPGGQNANLTLTSAALLFSKTKQFMARTF